MKKFRFAILALVILGSVTVYAAVTVMVENSNADFKATYFQDTPDSLDQVNEDNAYFAIVAAFPTQDQAESWAAKTIKANSDIALSVYQPDPKNFTVMIAANVSSDLSMKACRFAKDRKIGNIHIQWRYPHVKNPC